MCVNVSMACSHITAAGNMLQTSLLEICCRPVFACIHVGDRTVHQVEVFSLRGYKLHACVQACTVVYVVRNVPENWHHIWSQVEVAIWLNECVRQSCQVAVVQSR